MHLPKLTDVQHREPQCKLWTSVNSNTVTNGSSIVKKCTILMQDINHRNSVCVCVCECVWGEGRRVYGKSVDAKSLGHIPDFSVNLKLF